MILEKYDSKGFPCCSPALCTKVSSAFSVVFHGMYSLYDNNQYNNAFLVQGCYENDVSHWDACSFLLSGGVILPVVTVKGR